MSSSGLGFKGDWVWPDSGLAGILPNSDSVVHIFGWIRIDCWNLIEIGIEMLTNQESEPALIP